MNTLKIKPNLRFYILSLFLLLMIFVISFYFSDFFSKILFIIISLILVSALLFEDIYLIKRNNSIIGKIASDLDLKITQDPGIFLLFKGMMYARGNYKDRELIMQNRFSFSDQAVNDDASIIGKILFKQDGIQVTLSSENRIPHYFFLRKNIFGKIVFKYNRYSLIKMKEEGDIKKKIGDLSVFEKIKDLEFRFFQNASTLYTTQKDPKIITKYIELLYQYSRRLE